jgi:Uma2 family endonuclease
MSQPPLVTEPHAPTKLSVRGIKLTNQRFAQLCRENPELRLELTAKQELVIMAPTGSETGRRSGELFYAFMAWTKKDGGGISFDSSTGFTLPNGAIRSPDASWVKRERWEALSKDQREGFAPLCPDFVIELRSRTDLLADLQAKMQEYIDNGAHLGWLIDPIDKRVYVYQPNQPVEVLDDPALVSGDPFLPGFVLHVRELW